MKAEELRIGNAIEWSGNIHTVESIQKEWVTIRKKNMEELRLPYHEIKPIPLTKEWLIDKFEATLIGIEYKLRASALEITIRINAGQIYCEFGNVYLGGQIQYVHELQNLVHSLCGKELSVKF